jgi:hypothetical protein
VTGVIILSTQLPPIKLTIFSVLDILQREADPGATPGSAGPPAAALHVGIGKDDGD